MDIELYQLIQQVSEMARQAAIDKAAAFGSIQSKFTKIRRK